MNDIKLYEDSKNEIITSETTEKRKTFNEIYFQQKEEIQIEIIRQEVSE